jgi:hypothetical protein
MESNQIIDILFNDLDSKDDKIRYPAFKKLQEITEQPVGWIYDKWYLLVDKLSSNNSYQRTIGFMLLANLCKSDTQHRTGCILNNLLNVTEDEKFITARQAFQNIWKIAVIDPSFENTITKYLEKSWVENIHLKNHPNLIKQDIIFSLWNIYKAKNNKSVNDLITHLIVSENDEKFIKALKKILK